MYGLERSQLPLFTTNTVFYIRKMLLMLSLVKMQSLIDTQTQHSIDRTFETKFLLIKIFPFLVFVVSMFKMTKTNIA